MGQGEVRSTNPNDLRSLCTMIAKDVAGWTKEDARPSLISYNDEDEPFGPIDDRPILIPEYADAVGSDWEDADDESAGDWHSGPADTFDDDYIEEPDYVRDQDGELVRVRHFDDGHGGIGASDYFDEDNGWMIW